MIYPLKSIFITQLWGENPDMYSRFGLKGHNGIDFRASNGTPVYAPHDGIIKERRFDANGYGNYIKIESEKEGSVLAHFQDFAVNINKIVKEGDLVGHADNTGFSTGPHLHWGYYKIPRNRGDGYLGYINQLPLLKGKLMSNMYKGLDLNNPESMKTTVDVWRDVMDNKYVKSTTYDKIKTEKEKLDAQNSSYKAFIENIAKKLDCEPQEAIILGEIEELISKEDKVRPIEKENEEFKQKEQEKNEEIVEKKNHTHPGWVYIVGFAKKVA